ncbi:hypothetical protein [Asanoa sp. NPDC050611]|uniref:hypothetical protein n=1 Tax=Asanoa sp. NPDC050611 TaxID=3157098 RepID=UPI0033FCDD72
MKPDWRDTVRVATDVAVLGLLLVATSLPVLTTGAAFATASFAVHHFLTHDRWPRRRAVGRVFRRTLLPGAAATVAVAAAAWLVTVDLAAVSHGTVPGGAVMLGVTAVIAAAGVGYAALALVALGTHLADASHTDTDMAPMPTATTGVWRRRAATAALTPTATTGRRRRAASTDVWRGTAATDVWRGTAATDVWHGTATTDVWHGTATTDGSRGTATTDVRRGTATTAGSRRTASPRLWRRAARDAAAARPVSVAAAAGVVALAGLLAVLVHPILAACLVGYALYAVHVVARRLAVGAAPDLVRK